MQILRDNAMFYSFAPLKIHRVQSLKYVNHFALGFIVGSSITFSMDVSIRLKRDQAQ